jgi:hypothetical protein
MDDEQFPQRGLVAKKEGNLLSIEGSNKRVTLKQLASYCIKLLEDGYPKNGVIYLIYLCVMT